MSGQLTKESGVYTGENDSSSDQFSKQLNISRRSPRKGAIPAEVDQLEENDNPFQIGKSDSEL